MSSCVVSVKAVVLGTSHVLLARNHRDEWELPGGRPEPDEEPAETVHREVLEETGISVSVGDEIHVEDFEVQPGRSVTIRAFRCESGDTDSTRPSHEHTEVHWFPTDGLPACLPDVYRRAITQAIEPEQ